MNKLDFNLTKTDIYGNYSMSLKTSICADCTISTEFTMAYYHQHCPRKSCDFVGTLEELTYHIHCQIKKCDYVGSLEDCVSLFLGISHPKPEFLGFINHFHCEEIDPAVKNSTSRY